MAAAKWRGQGMRVASPWEDQLHPCAVLSWVLSVCKDWLCPKGAALWREHGKGHVGDLQFSPQAHHWTVMVWTGLCPVGLGLVATRAPWCGHRACRGQAAHAVHPLPAAWVPAVAPQGLGLWGASLHPTSQERALLVLGVRKPGQGWSQHLR